MHANDQLFIKGFNGGYLLEKYKPELLANILKNIDTTNVYLAGLSKGQFEYQKEIRLELENLSQLRDRGKDLDRNIS